MCPSGPRSYVQVVVCSHAWVRVPPLAFFLFKPFSDFLFSTMTEYILNYQEVLYYDAVFAFATNDGSEALSGKAAVSFLSKSGLSVEEIKQVGFTKDV